MWLLPWFQSFENKLVLKMISWKIWAYTLLLLIILMVSDDGEGAAFALFLKLG